MRTNRQNKNKGLTLVEIMIVLSIFLFILAAIYGMLASGRKSWQIGEALLRAQQQARHAVTYVERELRHAGRVVVRADLRQISFRTPVDSDGDGFIDFVSGQNVFGAENNANWSIEYEILPGSRELERRVVDDTGSVQSQLTIARDINPDVTRTFFRTTDTAGGSGTTYQGVDISLTTQIIQVQGVAVNAPTGIQMTLTTRTKLRN